MAQVAAIFDVDRTLVRGSTERLFFLYLLRHEKLNWPQALAFLGRLTRHPRERFRNKSYLRGMEVEGTVELARRCYQEAIAPRVSPAGVACVQEHRSRGHKIILLTGSLGFLVRPLKEELGAEWLIATELARYDHVFTGEIHGLHPRGENKWALLKELAQAQGIDLSSSYAYGDHIQDRCIFQGIGHPVAVNPSWRLKCLAQRHCWPIRYF